jgi:hypothetical protein
MRSLPLVATLLALPLMTACVYIDAEDDSRASYNIKTQFGIPALMAADIQADAVTIRINSNGCTTKETLAAEVDQDGRDEYEVAFDRLQEDRCRAYLPDGIELTYTYDELDIPEGAYVRVLNKIAG